jgi:hypothetical protein
MISLDVNGIDILVSPRAMQKLNKLLHRSGVMCDQSSVLPPYWGCTRALGHIGPHVAHGVEYEFGRADTYAVFVESEPTYGGK